MKNLPDGVLVSHIDFAENYNFAIQNEVQSMYYFTTSVTILVHITMWKEGETVMKQLTFTYRMTKIMILLMSNIACSCIGIGWRTLGLFQRGVQ
jgi:hypothetical protein